MTIVLNLIENILLLICNTAIFIVKILDRLLDFLARVSKILMIIAIFLIAMWAIDNLPQFWETLVLQILIFGGALTFISFVTLALWKPNRIEKVFSKL